MDKLKMETPDLTQSNIEKLAALFPTCVTEARGKNGKLKKAVDFELLRQMLSDVVLEGDEAYEFTWVGKKAAIVEANRPIRKTLRPCPEDSVAWDSTENLYIEGDNLEVLKLLQESYLGKVKMIYIDPSYNTGNDFIYRDDFAMSGEEYSEESGQVDENGARLFKNTDSNGRFHSDWCSMIYSRLLLARNHITAVHDYILVYVRNKKIWRPKLQERTDTALEKFKNPDNDLRGVWTSGDLTSKTKAAGHSYAIISPSGKEFYPPEGRQWAPAYETYLKLKAENRLWFGESGNNVPRQKQFLSEIQSGVVPTTIMFYSDCGHNQEAKKELLSLLSGIGNTFETPKPSRLLIKLMRLVNFEKGDIVLDFFSGSATTAHAVMQLNAEDGGHRKFIMVQLPEPCDEKSEAYKAGYPNICEIGKERIRRAARKIAADNPGKPFDGGFRVFKLDDTNMTDVYYSAGEYDQGMLDQLVSNIKPDRTDLDLLFGCLLEWGLPLSMPYTSEKIEGCTIHTYNDGDLIACFDEDIPDNVIKEIAKRRPLRVVFRDSSFADSPAKINVGEIFKMLAPDTTVKAL